MMKFYAMIALIILMMNMSNFNEKWIKNNACIGFVEISSEKSFYIFTTTKR